MQINLQVSCTKKYQYSFIELSFSDRRSIEDSERETGRVQLDFIYHFLSLHFRQELENHMGTPMLLLLYSG